MATTLALGATAPSAQERLPDPTERTSFHMPRQVAAAAPRWVLESTLIAEHRRVAVINGETVAVGDEIRGARVVRIDTHGVRLRTADGIIELSLSGTDPKRVAGGGAAP